MLDHTETVMNIQERFDSRVIIILTLSIHNIIQKISSDVYLSDHNYSIVASSQTSADKDSVSPDSSVLSLSGWTDRQRTVFF